MITQYPLLFKVSGEELITLKKGCIRHVIWNGATTTAHLASLIDKHDNILWQADATVVTEGPTRKADFNLDLSFDGLYCDDLDSGSLLIYYDKLSD